MAVMVKVLKLGGHVAGKLIAQDDTGREAVPNACLGSSNIRENCAVPINSVSKVGAKFPLLSEGAVANSRPRTQAIAMYGRQRVGFRSAAAGCDSQREAFRQNLPVIAIPLFHRPWPNAESHHSAVHFRRVKKYLLPSFINRLPVEVMFG